MASDLPVRITENANDWVDYVTAFGTLAAAVAAAAAAWVAVWSVRRTEIPNIIPSTALVAGRFVVRAANEGPRAVTIESVHFLDAAGKAHFPPYREKYGDDALPRHLVEGQRLKLEFEREALPKDARTVVIRDSVGRDYKTPFSPFLSGAKRRSLVRRGREPDRAKGLALRFRRFFRS